MTHWTDLPRFGCAARSWSAGVWTVLASDRPCGERDLDVRQRVAGYRGGEHSMSVEIDAQPVHLWVRVDPEAFPRHPVHQDRNIRLDTPLVHRVGQVVR